METLGEVRGFEYMIFSGEEETYLLCDLGGNMYMFLSPTRKETDLPTISSERSCWVCDTETEHGIFCYSGLFFGGELVSTNPVHVCMGCFNELTIGWSEINEEATTKGVAEQL